MRPTGCLAIDAVFDIARNIVNLRYEDIPPEIVDLTSGHLTEEFLDETVLRKWGGGAGLGAKYLYEEVPPGVEWDDGRNRTSRKGMKV